MCHGQNIEYGVWSSHHYEEILTVGLTSMSALMTIPQFMVYSTLW